MIQKRILISRVKNHQISSLSYSSVLLPNIKTSEVAQPPLPSPVFVIGLRLRVLTFVLEPRGFRAFGSCYPVNLFIQSVPRSHLNRKGPDIQYTLSSDIFETIAFVPWQVASFVVLWGPNVIVFVSTALLIDNSLTPSIIMTLYSRLILISLHSNQFTACYDLSHFMTFQNF